MLWKKQKSSGILLGKHGFIWPLSLIFVALLVFLVGHEINAKSKAFKPSSTTDMPRRIRGYEIEMPERQYCAVWPPDPLSCEITERPWWKPSWWPDLPDNSNVHMHFGAAR